MIQRLQAAFYRLVIGHPFWLIAIAAVGVAAAGYQARHFELDASPESLLVEQSPTLDTYRAVRSTYGSDAPLFVTFSPEQPLFSDASLATLEALAGDLAALDGVASVTHMLNVPLIETTDVTFSSLAEDVPTLGEGDVTPDQARREFLNSPLYRDLIINDEADTTAMLVRLEHDSAYQELIERRRELRAQRGEGELDAEARTELDQLERRIDERKNAARARLEERVGAIRGVLEQYRDDARIHLGGVPMIAVDMLDFVANDIRTFGVAVGLFIVVLLALAFRRPRWVVAPAVICASVVVGLFGFIGTMGWPVTVVSSNFVSLALIITLSLLVHLIVRYRELQVADPEADQAKLLRQTLDSKFTPSLFTALTTGISFAALMLADIQPVKDFGLIMVWAVALGFATTFVLFPALLAWLAKPPAPRLQGDVTQRATLGVAQVVRRHSTATVAVFVVLAVLGVAGALQLTVENRFIDYFHEDTEIYQGMRLIDRELGGTTPLDVVIDAPESFLEDYQADQAFAEELGMADSEPNPAAGYWYNARKLEDAGEIHDYLAGIDATGKVLSMATLWRMALSINDGETLEPFQLGVLYNRLPPDLREQLIEPYMRPDGNQIRFDIRVIDSLPGLNRDALLERIRTELPERFDLNPEQVTLSGMLVLYNNVLQSLFESQFVTLAIVFVAILLMFGGLYRSWRMALIGPIPTAVAACLELGVMGWIGLPLDIMTMTIAAIVIGIGVDDTIHYVDRVRDEVAAGADYNEASRIAHAEVGRALVYTTIIITLGFSILTLSNFMPTIYFGLLTGLAMIFALVSNLALLPVLVRWLRPFGLPTGPR